MNNVQQLKQAIAQNAADTRAAAQATVRDFVEGQKVDIDDVIAALGVLGMTVSTVETASQLYAELSRLDVPAPSQLSALQQKHDALRAKFNAEVARLKAAGVQAIDRPGGGYGYRVSPLVRDSHDAMRAAKFALDAGVNALARADELREQIAVLLGEKDPPRPAPRPELIVRGAADPHTKTITRAGEKSQRIVRLPNGQVAVEAFDRDKAPEGNPARRPASEIVSRFFRGQRVDLDG